MTAGTVPSQTLPAARVVDAVKVYGSGDTGVRALDGVSVDFPAGRFTAIMGPSGSGKSTLMHCAAGLDTLTAGGAYIGDTDLGALDDRRLTLLRRDRVGFVFQAFNLVPTLTVEENIRLPLDLAGGKGDAEWIDALVDVVAVTLTGVLVSPSLWPAGAGAVLALAAFVVLGPVAATAAVRVLGRPLDRLRGVTGGLARRNALRSPRRTAATASALMIGVAVVSLFTVFGASLKATMDQTVSRSFAGDVAVSTPSFGAGGSGLSPRLAAAVQGLPEVDTAVGLGRGVAEVNGSGRALTVTDPLALQRTFDLGTVRGSLSELGTHGIAITEKEAEKQGLAPGDRVRLGFTDGETETFTVRAVYGQSELAGDYVITRAAWAPHRTQDSDTLVAVSFKDGVSADAGKAAVEKVAERYGNPEVQTRDEYAQSSAGGIDMMLTLVYALLALAVLIALLGIANTLSLAVHERTRELGLLRAVGQTRSQLRAMVRWESVLVAAFGTVGGLGLGAFLGWVLVEASDGASDSTFAFAMPPLQLAVVALVGLAAGALAGLRPARRAARLDVLRAIATQ